ncbi:MAG: tetratricopeptide repeat protein [Burkholderiales bacterium]
MAGNFDRAFRLCQRALKSDGGNIDAWSILGEVGILVGNPQIAIDAGTRATSVDASSARAHFCLGAGLRGIQHFEASIGALRRALELDENFAPALIEIANIYLDLSDAKGANPFLDRALELAPGDGAVQMALGRMYGAKGRQDDAVAAFERAVILRPHAAAAHNALGEAYRDVGCLEQAIAQFRRSLKCAPTMPAWSNLLVSLQCWPNIDGEDLFAAHKQFGEYFSQGLRRMPLAPHKRMDGRRLRIGYVSGNFRRHANAKFIIPLLAAHDRQRFDVTCYFNGVLTDEITQQVRRLADSFVPIGSMLDGQAAAVIRRHEIDILVDLDGHIPNNRLSLFLMKPAPIQVTWLGYLSTTGIEAVDYRLSDTRADPVGITDRYHVEEIWRLPNTAWCYDPYHEAPPISDLPPCATTGVVTFASLNSPVKISEPVLACWVSILRANMSSRLFLHFGGAQSQRTNLMSYFESNGIASNRVTLLPRQGIRDYLATFNQVDIALDTWPCAGGTTTCDSLWMGVPVVTQAGDRSYSRAGASILASCGLDDLICNNSYEYVDRALNLARDLDRLVRLRSDLRRVFNTSSLFDRQRFARDVEDAFVAMYQRRQTTELRSRV